jgi:phage FluMu protein Com
MASLSSHRTEVSPFVDVRCVRCARLLLRWERTGTAVLNVKCPRCGSIDTVRLSTAR